jgi:hypothetical protein
LKDHDVTCLFSKCKSLFGGKSQYGFIASIQLQEIQLHMNDSTLGDLSAILYNYQKYDKNSLIQLKADRELLSKNSSFQGPLQKVKEHIEIW